MIEATLNALIDRFNAHAQRTPSVQDELRGIVRTIRIRLTDERSYTVELKDGRLGNLRSEENGRADLTVTTDQATFLGLVKKEIGPMKALVTRKLAIDGSLEDKLLFRKLL